MEGILMILGALFLIGLVVGLIKLIIDVIVEVAKFLMAVGAVALIGYLAYILIN